MSVSGFSVAHDAEVQAYNRMRAQMKAEKKRLREEQKINESRRSSLTKMEDWVGQKLAKLGSRKALSVQGRVVDAKELEDDSDFEGDSSCDLKDALKIQA